MMPQIIPPDVIQFFQGQGSVIVSTIDQKGLPHNSCKGIIEINRNGLIYLLDVYKQKTFQNLKGNPNISITAVDEHRFVGYSLKGRAKIIASANLDPKVIKSWEERVSGRISQRLIRNIHEEKGHAHHPEAQLPKPEYLIAVKVNEIVDLTPHHIKERR